MDDNNDSSSESASCSVSETSQHKSSKNQLTTSLHFYLNKQNMKCQNSNYLFRFTTITTEKRRKYVNKC